MNNWRGIVIGEGLSDPTILNKFKIFKIFITEKDKNIDYSGNKGRWHIYWLECNKNQIDEIQSKIIKGWYAHFWQNNNIVVVYEDKQFLIDKNNKETWKNAVLYGKEQGISESELDFPTE